MWCSILATDLLSKEAAHLSTVGHERKLSTQKGKSTDAKKVSSLEGTTFCNLTNYYLTLMNLKRYIFWYFALSLAIINYQAYDPENFLIHNQKCNRGFSLSDRPYRWRNLPTHLI